MSELRLRVIDSHTEGEPTRVIVAGSPDLGSGSMQDRLRVLKTQHDWVRSGAVCEPRGSDAVVGALLCQPSHEAADAAVIFFNNVGYLGMCGHGTMGLVRTLQHLGKIAPGRLHIETPVGEVAATLHEDGRVSVQNVPAYRHATGVQLQVDGYGAVVGDVAYGGNWFFLLENPGLPFNSSDIEALTRFTRKVRESLKEQDVHGAEGAEIDHIEVFAPPQRKDANSRNFVLCPGLAYDRSPCGTGLSAKLACLAADCKLAPGQLWRQESIIGTLFEGSYQPCGDRILPTITGTAYVTGEADLILSEEDPLRFGINQ